MSAPTVSDRLCLHQQTFFFEGLTSMSKLGSSFLCPEMVMDGCLFSALADPFSWKQRSQRLLPLLCQRDETTQSPGSGCSLAPQCPPHLFVSPEYGKPARVVVVRSLLWGRGTAPCQFVVHMLFRSTTSCHTLWGGSFIHPERLSSLFITPGTFTLQHSAQLRF